MTRQPFRLTPEQYAMLTQALDENRVGRNPKGFSHLEAWDVRRWLIRIFGFGAFDIETISLDLVKEIENPPGAIKYGNGGTNQKTVWTVVYRAQVRLTIWDQFGGYVVLEDGACGDSTNQPSLGDCHDNASKTALSQALKRCAVNLGDQFGLSLYNGGSPQPVVHRSLVKPAEGTSAPVADLPAQDEPVRPEPGTEPVADPVSAPPASDAPVSAPPAGEPVPEAEARPAPTATGVRDWALKSDRTADGIRKTAAKLLQEHPEIAATRVVNEHGDDEQLSVLLERRARELTPAAQQPTAHDERRRKRMFALFTELGYGDREKYHQVIQRVVKRPISSSKELTPDEVEDLIVALELRKRQLAARQQEQAVAA